jgi:ATP-binding cassette subfamily C protein
MNSNNVMLPDWFLQRGGAKVGDVGKKTPPDGVVWIIQQGHIDIFVVATNAGMAEGVREHLVSLSSGQLFVFPEIAPDATHRLVASISPHTQYLVLSNKAFSTLLDDEDGALLLLPMVDSLLRILPHKNFGDSPPKSETLSAGGDISTDDSARTWVPEGGGLWTQLLRGKASYCGSDGAPIPALMPLPVGAWIRLEQNSALSCLSAEATGAALPGTCILLGIEAVVNLIIHVTETARQKREADDLVRLQRKSELGRKAMAEALGNLASLFDDASAEVSLNANALLGACNIIGKTMGVAFALPASGVDINKTRDPVKFLAETAGVRTRIVALKGEWWKNDNGPLLVFSENERQPFALLHLKSGTYQMISPLTGEKKIIDVVLAGEFAKFGYMFYRGLPKKNLVAKDILKFTLHGVRPEIKSIAAIGVASALLAMAIPVASGYLFDDIFPAADRFQMMEVVAILFIASIVNLLFEATRSLLLLRIEGKASSDLQSAVWDRVLNLPVPFFRQYSVGDLATRINGINDIRQVLSGAVISSVINALFSVLNIFLMLHYSAKLTMMALLLIGAALLFNLTVAYFRIDITRATVELNGAVAGRILEYLSGLTKLRVTGSEGRAFANWSKDFADQKRLGLRAGNWANASAVFSAVFPLLSSAFIFMCITWFATEQDSTHFSTGDFIAFNVAFTLFLNAVLGLVNTATILVDVMPTYQRTKPILETVPEVDESKADPGRLSGAIELSHVSFSYVSDGPAILTDVSIRIEPGEFVALVGASGSGKSTLLRLMLGFEKPSQGDIYFDNHNMNDVDIGAVRRQLGVVLQGGRVMSGDIFKNIIGSSSLLLDDAWEAARACGLDKDIESMPMGMHTIVSDGGGTLSGGQRQRLLIARAIVHKPCILFFDEATSALDNRTQAIVSASMEQLQATRVVIAHRLSTIINADRIFVLDKGKIVQSGTYSELMQEKGLFSESAKRQLA